MILKHHTVTEVGLVIGGGVEAAGLWVLVGLTALETVLGRVLTGAGRGMGCVLALLEGGVLVVGVGVAIGILMLAK